MQNLVALAQAWLVANWVFVVIAIVYLALHYLYGKRSQVDAWCESRPVIAGLTKIIRAFLPDPWLLVQGATLVLKGRLPEGYKQIVDKLAKILAASAVLLVIGGCSILNPRPSTPCPGLYCISVGMPVPGSAKLCYDTDAQRAAAVRQLESEGKKVTVIR